MGELPDEIRIERDGLVLREFTEADLPAYAELLDDPATNRFYALADMVDLDVVKAHFARVTAARAEGKAVSLAITDGERLIGQAMIGLANGVLSGTIGAAHRGQGLAKRVGRLVVDYAHEVLGIQTLIAEIDPNNHAMSAVVERLGFVRIGPDTYEDRGKTVTVMRWEHTSTPAESDRG
jgi:RimJ/RimL family protein N-acetyltransferase